MPLHHSVKKIISRCYSYGRKGMKYQSYRFYYVFGLFSVVSKSMLQLSTKTSVLAQPHKLPEDIYNLIAKQEDMQTNSSSNNNNSSGSSSSSRSSSLVRQ